MASKLDDLKEMPLEGSGLDERLTWGEGDFVIIGPDGKPVDLMKKAGRPAPVVHVYLPDDDEDAPEVET